MTLKEFKEHSEHVIIRNHIQFHFNKVREHHWLLEVPIPTLSKNTEYGNAYDYVHAVTTMTSIEAYNAYINILRRWTE